MANNGATRTVLAKVQGKSQAEINKAFENQNVEAESVKKIPLKNPSEHNHSK